MSAFLLHKYIQIYPFASFRGYFYPDNLFFADKSESNPDELMQEKFKIFDDVQKFLPISMC